jgi:hypothetical protein
MHVRRYAAAKANGAFNYSSVGSFPDVGAYFDYEFMSENGPSEEDLGLGMYGD